MKFVLVFPQFHGRVEAVHAEGSHEVIHHPFIVVKLFEMDAHGVTV